MKIFERIDARIPLAQEERMILHAVRKLAREEITSRAAEVDNTGEMSWRNVHAINQLGLNAMFIPEAYGGAPLSYACYLACVREIAAACASTAITWATNFHAIGPLIDFGTEEQKCRLLPVIAGGGLAALAITEASAGSDATGMKTTFHDEGGHIRVEGSKLFITNGGIADVYLVFGRWAGVDDAKAAISAVLIEKGTAGFGVSRVENKMGMRGSVTAGLTFDRCRVPKHNLLAGPGDGLRILLASLNKSRPSVAAHALGIARAAFQDAVEYINMRKQSGRRVLEFQGIQFMIADLSAELALAESWLWSVARMVDAGETDIGLEASILKLRASDLAMRIATDAVQLFGGYGYCRDYRVERLMRDAKITQIWEGTNQIHRKIIGRSFLQKEAR